MAACNPVDKRPLAPYNRREGGDVVKSKRFWQIAVAVGIVLWTAFIWSQSLQSAEDSSADSGRIARLLMGLFGWDTQPQWLTYAIRKTAHFAEFAVLGVLWAAGQRTYGRRFLWLWGLPTGAVDECLQFFAPGRAPMATDVAIDAAGYLCGAALLLLLWRNRKEKETKL